MAKLSIGSWAYAFGPYEDHPIPFDTVVKRLGELSFDGVEVAGFPPHIGPDDYPMKSDRDAVKALMAESGLGTSQGQKLLARSGFADKANQRALIGDEIAL